MIIFYKPHQITVVSELSVYYSRDGEEVYYEFNRTRKGILKLLSAELNTCWSIEI